MWCIFIALVCTVSFAITSGIIIRDCMKRRFQSSNQAIARHNRWRHHGSVWPEPRRANTRRPRQQRPQQSRRGLSMSLTATLGRLSGLTSKRVSPDIAMHQPSSSSSSSSSPSLHAQVGRPSRTVRRETRHVGAWDEESWLDSRESEEMPPSLARIRVESGLSGHETDSVPRGWAGHGDWPYAESPLSPDRSDRTSPRPVLGPAHPPSNRAPSMSSVHAPGRPDTPPPTYAQHRSDEPIFDHYRRAPLASRLPPVYC